MNSILRQSAQTIIAITLVNSVLPAIADTYQGSISHSHGPTYMQRHPKVKSAAVGAGVGVAAGGLTGLISGKGMMRGAAIGAGTGAGVGLIHSSKSLNSHPYVKKSAEGGLAGLGLGMAATRGHGSGRKVAATTGIGAALGAGAAYLSRDKH